MSELLSILAVATVLMLVLFADVILCAVLGLCERCRAALGGEVKP